MIDLKYITLHYQFKGLLQLFLGLLNIHYEHILSSTTATGYNLFVKMIFGYIAATST